MASRLLRLLGLLLCIGAASTAPAAAASSVRHVFVIVLENQNASTTFGPGSPAPYLANTLTSAGAFVPGYYGIGHNSLDNYIAMVSGQAPTVATQGDCPDFIDVLPGTPTSDGQVLGQGCVYPASVQTVAGQLQARGLTWKGYMEDMGNNPARDNGVTCAHPAIGSPDGTQQATATDQYATRHNPFVYFHSIIDNPAGCQARDVPLSRLPTDLASVKSTPNLSFITPNLCHDGHDAPCADGTPGGLPAADAFLRQWVPQITASPAFQRDGLLVIAFDEAGSDSTSCCGEQSGPNTLAAGGPMGGSGGGRTGAVLLSPFIAPGTVSAQDYNHYSLLRSIEDAFGLAHLGYAAAPGLRAFGSDIFTASPTK
jgi:phosphatidylinositol-3-phosphatase